jgi:Bacterial pre-peptidase C-terminal domain
VPNRFSLTVAYDGSSAPVGIGPGAHPGQQCNGNALFGVEAPGGKRLVAAITFDAAAGDLDLQLLDAEGVPLATSEAFETSSERIEYVAPYDEKLTLRVYNATNAFDLELKVEEP